MAQNSVSFSKVNKFQDAAYIFRMNSPVCLTNQSIKTGRRA